MKGASHDAAIGVAANDYLGHPENADRVFDRGGDAADGVGVGRDNVADDAADEKLAGFGLGQQAGVDAGIGAGDEEGFGALAQG
jgi:hypothetical protein